MSIKLRVLTFLCLFTLLSLSIPSYAAEPEPDNSTFSLNIHCLFSDSEDNTVENHMVNRFVILDNLSSTYLIADVDPATGYYNITGSSSSIDSATKFTSGLTSQTGDLIVYNLHASHYSLIHVQTASTYPLCNDPISLSIISAQNNESCVIIDSKEVELTDSMIDFSVLVTRSFHLPLCPCETCQRLSQINRIICRTSPFLTALSLVLLFLGIFLLLKKHK